MIKIYKKIAIVLAVLMVISTGSIGYAYADVETNTNTDVTAEVQSGSNDGIIEESDTDAEVDPDLVKGLESDEVTEEEALPREPYTGTFPTLPNGAEAIAQTAINLAWPYGTASSVYAYPSGKPTNAFKVALDEVFPDRSGWGKQSRLGASCDVFAGTIIRYSGYDTNAPRGVTPALTYFKNYPEKWTATGIYKVADMKPGDVIVWKKKSGTKHIMVFVKVNGVSYFAEAHHGLKKYGAIHRKAFTYNLSNMSSFEIYRANSAYQGSLDKGYKGTNVKHLQSFLNWAGFDCGAVDGEFGSMTEAAVKAFQTAAGLTVDGRFGKQSLAAAKTYIPSNGPITHKYGGSFPKIGKKNLKYKMRSSQVKKLQKFLNWYGDYKLKSDGYFGKSTRTAVKKFQKAEGLKVDGVFGKKSLKVAKTIKK